MEELKKPKPSDTVDLYIPFKDEMDKLSVKTSDHVKVKKQEKVIGGRMAEELKKAKERKKMEAEGASGGGGTGEKSKGGRDVAN